MTHYEHLALLAERATAGDFRNYFSRCVLHWIDSSLLDFTKGKCLEIDVNVFLMKCGVLNVMVHGE